MGAVALDSSVLVGFFSERDAHHAQAVSELTNRIATRDDLILCASAYAEIAVQPARDGRVEVLDAALAEAGIEVVPVDRAIAGRAARIRARHSSLRLPDALVVAMAIERQAELVTFDNRMARVHRGETGTA